MSTARSVPILLRLSLALAAAAHAGGARADDAPASSLHFNHGDWELVCDNTGTCRAAGYQVDADSAPVSVLLTRAAGAGTPVEGMLSLGEDWSGDAAAPLPGKVTLRIDGRAQGEVSLAAREGRGRLQPRQVAALIAALRRDSRIEFHGATTDATWRLSDAGASAVLLKMDDAQGRVGTTGALQRKGARDESGVPAATPEPVLRAVGAVPARRGDDAIATRHAQALRAALRATDPGQEECMDLHDTGRATEDASLALEVHRLDARRLLVRTRCWLAAYNAGEGFWIVDDAPPFRATLVTAQGNDLRIDATRVEIGAAHKGRGIGDCWSHDSWTWDGARFVHTAAGGTGMCRGFPGGAWDMPSLVTKVVEAGGATR